MRRQTKLWMSVGLVLVVGLVVILAWPAPNPLADAQTVAIRSSSSASASSINLREELQLVLSGRNLRIISDESAADLVVTLDEVRVNLGDVEVSLSDGDLRGRASAVCIVTDVRSGRTYTMDLLVRFDTKGVHASLSGRRFWQFWK